eukprot:RCo028538
MGTVARSVFSFLLFSFCECISVSFLFNPGPNCTAPGSPFALFNENYHAGLLLGLAELSGSRQVELAGPGSTTTAPLAVLGGLCGSPASGAALAGSAVVIGELLADAVRLGPGFLGPALLPRASAPMVTAAPAQLSLRAALEDELAALVEFAARSHIEESTTGGSGVALDVGLGFA